MVGQLCVFGGNQKSYIPFGFYLPFAVFHYISMNFIVIIVKKGNKYQNSKVVKKQKLSENDIMTAGK